MAKAGGVIAAAFVAVGGAIAFAMKGAIDDADELGKAAQKWGVPVDELSRLKHAADLSGVSFERLGTGISKLSRNMSEVAGGATNTASKAFDALGISVKNSDGTLKSSSQVMTEVAGKFGGMEDGAGKTALAMALFGKSGAELIPLLNGGAQGLQDMMTEADQLGIVIDQKTAKSAEAFNDNLTRLGKVKDGIITQITARMLPALESMSHVLIDAAKNSGLMDQVARVLTSTLQGLVTAGTIVGAAFKVVGETIAAVASAIVLAAQGKFSEAWDALKVGATDVIGTVKGTADVLKTIWVGAAEANAAAAAELAAKIAAPIIQSAEKAKEATDALNKFLETQVKQQAARAAEIATIDMATGANERLRVQMQALAIAQQNGIVLSEAQRAKIAEVAGGAETLAQKLKGAQLVQSAKEPHELYRAEIENNSLVLAAFGATAEQIAAVQEKTAERFANTWNQAGESVAGSFKEIGASFSKESSAMATVAKAAGIVQATISMFTGAAKALELPFPANIAASVAVLAKGAALLASIRSTSVGGFATGGSFRVPGAGMADSQRLMMDLSPGEQVDVWRPGDMGDDPRRGAGPGRDITIRLEGEVFGQKAIRALIDGINEALRDGARLRMA